MDLTYYIKKVLGTATAEDEQAYRAKLAQNYEARQQSMRQPVMAPQPVAEQIQTGNVLQQRQALMDDAVNELQRQNGMRQAPVTLPR